MYIVLQILIKKNLENLRTLGLQSRIRLVPSDAAPRVRYVGTRGLVLTSRTLVL